MKINSKTASSFNNNLGYCSSLQQLKPGMIVKLFTSTELVHMGIVKIKGKYMNLKVSNSGEKPYYTTIDEVYVEDYDEFVNDNDKHGLRVKKLDDTDEKLDVELETIDEYDWVWVNHQFIELPN